MTRYNWSKCIIVWHHLNYFKPLPAAMLTSHLSPVALRANPYTWKDSFSTHHVFLELLLLGLVVERHQMASQLLVKHLVLGVQDQEDQIKSGGMKKAHSISNIWSPTIVYWYTIYMNRCHVHKTALQFSTALTSTLTHWGQVVQICVSKITIISSDWSVPSHYLNQCWNIVNWTFRNKLGWNLNWNW